MTTDVFRRVVWKEFRVLRAFGIALVLIVITTQALAWTYVPSSGAQDAFVGIMTAAVALYALGAGAIMFAAEREEGTDVFLQALPVESRELFAKLALALASTIAIAVVLSAVLFAYHAAGLIDSPPRDQASWLQLVPSRIAGLIAMTLLAFACGLCCSLLARRPLVAACLGAGMALVLAYPAHIASLVAVYFGYARTMQDAEPLWNYTLLATAVVVLAVDVALAGRWLTGLQVGERISRRIAPDRPVVETLLGRRATRPSMLTAFGRLLWQDLRQSWRMMVLFVGLPTLVCLGIAQMRDSAEYRTNMATLVALAMMTIIGAATFLPDQERSQFRFFAERPVRPRMVWLNRQLVWFPLVFLYLLIAALFWCVELFETPLPLITRYHDVVRYDYRLPVRFSEGLFALPRICVLAVAAVLAYCSGQFCSMMFRSGIVAGFLALGVTAGVMAWSALMGTFNVDWRLSVGSLAVVLLWVTWLRAPDWIGERTDGRAWTRLGLSIALPLAGIVLATISYRVWQIPRVDPGFSVEHYDAQVTPAARETADMYRQAERLVNLERYPRGSKVLVDRADKLAAVLANAISRYGDPPIDGEAREEWLALRAIPHDQNMLPWLADNQEALRLALAATERPECVFPLGHSNSIWHCEKLIGTEAHRRGLAGDLDGMFECEMALLRMSVHLRNHQFNSHGENFERDTLDVIAYWWATRPGQTSERLHRALDAITQWELTVPPPTDAPEASYVWLRRLLDFDPEIINGPIRPDKSLIESIAAAKVLVRLMPWEMVRARRGANVLANGQLLIAQLIEQNLVSGQPNARLARHYDNPHEYNIAETTPILRLFPYYYWDRSQNAWVEGLLHRSSTRLLLALQAWRLEHGQLPDVLHQLEGPYFDHLPRDPYSGQDFRYFPHGLPARPEVYLSTRKPLTSPMLWSCGSRLEPVETGEYADVTWSGGRSVHTSSFENVMHHGQFVRIPSPAAGADAGNTEEATDDARAPDAAPPAAKQPAAEQPADEQPADEQPQGEHNP